MTSKYTFNQILATLSIILFVGIFGWLAAQNEISWIQSILVITILIIVEHYLLNLTHIASHRSISKNPVVNDFIGNIIAILTGISLPVFRETHNLHHANPNNPDKDPDHFISTRGQLWWIAGRIFYHDYFFFKNNLHKRKGNLKTYIAGRAIQVIILVLLSVNQKLDIWIYYWLPSILVIGSFYGLFQFYFPHYSIKIIDSWRTQNNKNIVQTFVLFLIDFSCYYHYKHHEKIKDNTYYFPLYTFLKDKFYSKKIFSKLLTEIKY